MICDNCGKENNSNQNYCTGCGEKLEREVKPKKNRKKLMVFVGLVIVVGVAFIGYQMDLFGSSSSSVVKSVADNILGRDYVGEYLSANEQHIETIDTLVSDEDFSDLYDYMEESMISDNELYSSVIKIEDLTAEERKSATKANNAIKEKIADINKDNYISILKGLYEVDDMEAIDKYFDVTKLSSEDYNELSDMLLEIFASQGDYENTNNLLRGKMETFSVDNVDRVLELKNELNEKYSNMNYGIEYINLEKYDQISNFEEGLAKVGVYNNTDDDGNPIYKWGLVNSKGEEIVDPKYDKIGSFLEDRAAVQLNEKWGFINKSGEEIIPLQFDALKDPLDSTFFVYAKRNPEDVHKGFYNGFAGVNKNDKWGFINKNGDVLGPGIIYKSVQNFSEGSGVVRIGDHWGLLNASGEYVVEPGIAYPNYQVLGVIRPIYEGLAGANWDDRKRRGLINSSGRIVKVFDKRNVDLVQDFREGLASVRKIKNGKSQWGFINTSGNIVISTQYDSVTVFINGVAKVEKNGKYGLINRTGQEILPIQYDSISEFKDGLAIITDGILKGVVDNSGTIVTPVSYQAIHLFDNNVTSFKKNDLWGVLDRNNTVIVPPVFKEMKEFKDGLAAAKYGGKWGYIDAQGFFLIEPQYDIANTFSNGVASVKIGQETGIVKLDSIPSRVEGQIVDAQNNPLKEVTVHITRKGHTIPYTSIKTDDRGMFSAFVKEGEYFIQLIDDEYLDVKSHLDIEEGSEIFNSKIITTKDDGETNVVTSEIYTADALSGGGIENVSIRFRKGYNNKTGPYITDEAGEVIVTSTDKDGAAKFDLVEGAYTAETEFKDYTKNYINTIVSDNLDKEYFSNKRVPLTPILPDGKYRITLEWGRKPDDLDAHIYGRANNVDFHSYYPLKGNIVNGVRLDKDDTSGNGFETITIEEEYDGYYNYSVFNYSDQNSYQSRTLSESNAKVNVYKGSQLLVSYDVPTNKNGLLWRVFEINNGELKSFNEITNHFDKSFFTE